MKTDLTLREGLGRPLYHSEHDTNFKRLMYWSGSWAAGSYQPNEVVWHHGGLWVCLVETVTDPSTANTDWLCIAPQPGRGGMQTNSGAISDIPATTYRPLLFSTVTKPGYGMTLTPATGQFSFLWDGWWEFRLQINLEFTEAQASRFTNIRLWNQTDGVQLGGVVRVAVGRNQDGLSANIALRFAITDANKSDVLILEIGGGDALSGVTLYANTIDYLQITPSTE